MLFLGHDVELSIRWLAARKLFKKDSVNWRLWAPSLDTANQCAWPIDWIGPSNIDRERDARPPIDVPALEESDWLIYHQPAPRTPCKEGRGLNAPLDHFYDAIRYLEERNIIGYDSLLIYPINQAHPGAREGPAFIAWSSLPSFASADRYVGRDVSGGSRLVLKIGVVVIVGEHKPAFWNSKQTALADYRDSVGWMVCMWSINAECNHPTYDLSFSAQLPCGRDP